MTKAEIEALWRAGMSDRYYGNGEQFPGDREAVWMRNPAYLIFWQLVALSEGAYRG